MFMSTKTITITKEAYENLSRQKNPGESFTEVINRMTSKKGSIMDSFGKWKMSDKEVRKFRKELDEKWKNFGVKK